MSAICTLFEGDYHFGVGALANSAYHNGWRGVIFAGYRGALPPWAGCAKAQEAGTRLEFALGAAIHFVPLSTSAHLTNYKPDFMLDVWGTLALESSSLFYFDPDIVLHCPWNFFEEWVAHGVALCEDVNSPVSFNHPRRADWKKYFAPHGMLLRNSTEIYVNGGFIGISKTEKTFLRTWMEVQKIMALDLGGLEKSGLERSDSRMVPTYRFHRTDQDALNIALMASSCPVSIIGAEGMDFKPGGYVMAHALGKEKPWRKHYLLNALRGERPRLVDQYYWNAVNGPIQLYPRGRVKRRRLAMSVAGLVGRFYRKA